MKGKINLVAQEQLMNIGKNAGEYAYVLRPQTYSTIEHDDIVAYAAKAAHIPESSIELSLEAIFDAVDYFVVTGHNVKIPGLGTFAFALNAKVGFADEEGNVPNLSSRIRKMKINFLPNVKLKRAVQNASVSIKCLDRNGAPVKK